MHEEWVSRPAAAALGSTGVQKTATGLLGWPALHGEGGRNATPVAVDWSSGDLKSLTGITLPGHSMDLRTELDEWSRRPSPALLAEQWNQRQQRHQAKDAGNEIHM